VLVVRYADAMPEVLDAAERPQPATGQ